MPFELYSYRRIGDLENLLRGLPPAKGRIFLVGGSGDRALLSEIFSGSHTSYGFQVRRWDELYRLFAEALNVEHPRVQLDPPDHWLILYGIVKNFCAAGGELPPGAQRRGFLSLLGTEIRELIREEVSPDDLEGLYDEGNVLGSAFISLYRAYLEALDENGLSDSAGIPTETRRLLDLPGSEEVCRSLDLVLVGLSTLTHSQLALVRSLVGHGATVRFCAPDAGMADSYGASQQFGVDGKNLSAKRPFRAVRLSGGDPRQEFETAARSLALWEQGEGPMAEFGEWPGWGAIAFSVPQGRLADAREVFSRYGLPCSPEFRIAVSDSSPWRLSSACLDAATGGWGTEPVLRLLAEPWMRGLELDVENLRAKHPRGAKSWEKILAETDPAALEDFVSCREYAAKISSGGTALELLVALRKFLSGRLLRGARLAVDSPELDASVAIFSEALRELDRKILFIREVVRDIGSFGHARLSGADARAYLSAWAEGTTLEQFSGDDDCMKIFAGAPPALFHIPYWFLAGTEAASWPGGLRESPVLDETRREKLHESATLGLDRAHLPLLSEKRQQREFLFRRLLACGDLCTFACHSATDENERPQDVTSLLSDAEHDAWIKIEAKKISRNLDDLLASRYEPAIVPLEERHPDLRIENSLPIARSTPKILNASTDRVRLSSVDDFASCPYKFALRHILRYEEPLREGEFDVLKGGTALHLLWERVLSAYSESGCTASISGLADSLFEDVVNESYPELLGKSLRRSLYDLRTRVARSAAFQEEIENVIRPMRTRICVEYNLPPLTVEGVTFSGRCDRLDILNDGRFLLWDYKSGTSDRYKKAFQLACYALDLQKGAPDLGPCAGWGYLCMKDGRASGVWGADFKNALGKLVFPSKDLTLETGLEAAGELLENISSSMKSHDFSPNFESPDCRYCSFSGLCRKGELRGEVDDEEEESSDE